jgi:hypothetical protein
MNPSSTVHKATLTNVENVGVTRSKTLVSTLDHDDAPDKLLIIRHTDYEWYSCLNRYDKMF